ncbi:MAG TPA: helicase-related protein [Terriglobia bacterium]|nr:helicase-related protein [Terriglobia bacterium]
MDRPGSIGQYLTTFANELGERILESFPPLHGADDPPSPVLPKLLRRPFPGQTVAIMGVAGQLAQARSAAVVAECGAGKTLIALASLYVAARGGSFTACALVPPHLTIKWARESLQTIPHLRVFLIDGLRDTRSKTPNGIHEVRLRNGRIVREGLATTLTDLRLRKGYPSARARWNAICPQPAVFILSKETAKLGWFWRHAFSIAESGRYQGSVVNPDTGEPIYSTDDGERLLTADFKKARHSEWIGTKDDSEEPDLKARRKLFSALWQADGSKVRRSAVIDFIGRHLRNFFDFAIADEVHELKGADTAQGNALGTLASAAKKTIVLTGTLLGGYADDVYEILFRLQPRKMIECGFEHGVGVRPFMETYGLLETITTIEPAENACSEAKVTRRVRRRPGASPQLFGDFLMPLAAFLSLEDIAQALPPYREEVVRVEMDDLLKRAYQKLENEIKEALRQHPGNPSVISTGMNALLLYPDKPFNLGPLYGSEFDPETHRRERFVIAEPEDLDENRLYGKERRLLEEIQSSLSRGRNVQVFAVYTRTRDVTRRLERILQRDGIRVAVLTSDVKPELREAWYERQLAHGMQVCIAHPRLVCLGLDLWAFSDIFFYETGYSLYTLRQASRRSWRIGQTQDVSVKYFAYAKTAQETCLRLMGKKLLVALAMEGKFSAEGLQAVAEDDDLLMAMARELVTQQGIGESAEMVWRDIQAQNAAIVHAEARPAEPALDVGSIPHLELPESAAQPLPTVVDQLLLFSASLASTSSRKRAPRRSSSGLSSGEKQLMLF